MNVAKQLVESIEEPLLYARVDGVLTTNGDFLLMELELIEPLLSIASNEDAAGNFYNGLMSLVAS